MNFEEIMKRWSTFNPAQKLALTKKLVSVNDTPRNRELLKNQEMKYQKWTKTTSYDREVKVWQK